MDPEDEPGFLPTYPTGQEAVISPSRHSAARRMFDERLRVAELGGDHLWTAIATFLVDPAKLTDPTAQGYLDGENLAGVYLGCYRCEEPFEERLLRRRCRAKP